MAHSFVLLVSFFPIITTSSPNPLHPAPSGLEQGRRSKKTEMGSEFASVLCSSLRDLQMLACPFTRDLSRFFRVFHGNLLTPPIPDRRDTPCLIFHNTSQLPSWVHPWVPLLHQAGGFFGWLKTSNISCSPLGPGKLSRYTDAPVTVLLPNLQAAPTDLPLSPSSFNSWTVD